MFNKTIECKRGRKKGWILSQSDGRNIQLGERRSRRYYLGCFFNKKEIELAQFFPKLKKYDGIKALKESPYLLQIPSEASVEIGKILYEVTGDEKYLDLIKRNIDASPETISFVSILSYCKPCQRLYNILVDIYINNSNKVNRSTAVMGILYNKGIIKDRSSIKESNDVISLRKKFKSEDIAERKKILEKFESGGLAL